MSSKRTRNKDKPKPGPMENPGPGRANGRGKVRKRFGRSIIKLERHRSDDGKQVVFKREEHISWAMTQVSPLTRRANRRLHNRIARQSRKANR